MKIVKEILAHDGKRKVQIIQRDNGSFGFESLHFSDDPLEMAWVPQGGFSLCIAPTAEVAEREARGRVAWLSDQDTCPVDRSLLTEHRADGYIMRSCPTCWGLWVPARTVTAALGRLPSLAAVGANPQIKPALCCPDDQAALLSRHYHGVEIDLCTKCGGVWLNHGELELILEKRRRCVDRDKRGDAPDAYHATIDGVHLGMEAVGAIFEFLGDALGGL